MAESAESNLGLQTKVQREFARQIPDLETSEDEAGSVEAYFARVSEAIEGLKRSHVRRWLTLGHFAFGRFAMYADLAPGNWASHPVMDSLVGSIVSGTELSGDAGSSLCTPPEDYAIDRLAGLCCIARRTVAVVVALRGEPRTQSYQTAA